MRKYILITIISLLVGLIMSRILYSSYETFKVFNKIDYYFIKVAEYQDYNQMIDGMSKLGSYIYLIQDSKYQVISCITKDLTNVDVISKFYIDQGYNVETIKMDLSIPGLDDTLFETDPLFKSEVGIKELCIKTIEKYKEE